MPVFVLFCWNEQENKKKLCKNYRMRLTDENIFGKV